MARVLALLAALLAFPAYAWDIDQLMKLLSQNTVSQATFVEKKHIAMLDDVMTTGATLNELAKVLRKHGATRLSGWAVARTQPRVLPHDS